MEALAKAAKAAKVAKAAKASWAKDKSHRGKGKAHKAKAWLQPPEFSLGHLLSCAVLIFLDMWE